MPLDYTKRPTDAEFDAFVLYMEEKVWGGALQAMKEADTYYFQTNDIWDVFKARNPDIDVSFRPNFHPGEFPAKVDQAVNAHLTLEPRVHRAPTGPGKAAKTASSLVEKVTQAVINDCFTRATNFPTKENGKQMTLHAHTGLLTLLDLEGFLRPRRKEGEDKEDFERREWEWISSKQHWNPIKFVVPTAGEVLCDPMQASPPVMVWRRKITAYDLKDLLLRNTEKFRKLGGILGFFRNAWVGDFEMPADSYEPIEVIEWWTARLHGIKRKGKGAILWEPNTMGIQSYHQVWGGNAISPAGKDFDVKYWVNQALMYKVIEEIVMEAQATSAHHTLLMRAATARYGTTIEADEVAAQMKRGVFSNMQKADLWIEDTPDLPAWAAQHKETLQRAIDEHTFSPQVAGMREPPTETATSTLNRAESSSRTFRPVIAKMGHLWSLASSDVLKLFYYLNREGGATYKEFAEIGIGEDKLRVQDLGDPPQFHMLADFEQVDAAVQRELVLQEVMLAEKGYSSWDAVQRVRRVEDPEGLWEERMKDLARNDPDVMEEAIINAFRVEGYAEIADRREAALKLRKLQRMMGQPPTATPGAMQPAPVMPPTNGQGGMP